MTPAILSSTVWQLPASLPDDLAKFENAIAQFKSGAISATQFQVFRVPQGVYEQRESGLYMLRVRFPAGVALPHQLRKLSEVADRFGNGILHVTTRQDIQIHRVALDAIHPALVALAKAGLSTKGGGGNTVRNITGCPHAGVCTEEAFDTTPHVLALTEFMLADPQSFQLPRKYKIAFSGCSRDCSGATVNDLGFIAKDRDGVEGFSVYVGGGMGSSSRVGDLLEEFVLVSEAPLVAEAVKRVFNTYGNRKDKRQARIRYLIRQLSFAKFRALYEEQLALLRAHPPALPGRSSVPESPGLPGSHPKIEPPSISSEQARWQSANVTAQRQAGFFRVEIPLFLGDITSRSLMALADIVEKYGEKRIRTTHQQNLVMRWVAQAELGALYTELNRLGLAASDPDVLRGMIACTGASTCKLGICLSRGLAKGIADALFLSQLDLAALGKIQLSISGCPNACGRHPVADLGLFGAARRVDGRLVPHYVLQMGGHVEEGKTELASGHQVIPARQVPDFLTGLLSAYIGLPDRPAFRQFLIQSKDGLIKDLLAPYQRVPTFAEDKNFYYDWDAGEIFSLAGRGPGECGAGVMDLIEVDLKSAAEALQEGRSYSAAALAARALLVTRGEQAANDQESFELFLKHFIKPGLVDQRFASLMIKGAHGPSHLTTGWDVDTEEVAALVSAVQGLFKSMDATLQFPKKAEQTKSPEPASAAGTTKSPVHLEKDFRGVVCPLNYVKTKMALNTLKPGQVLSVLLDVHGARNVPDSVTKDGHEVSSITQEGETWRILIHKKSN